MKKPEREITDDPLTGALTLLGVLPPGGLAVTSKEKSPPVSRGGGGRE